MFIRDRHPGREGQEAGPAELKCSTGPTRLLHNWTEKAAVCGGGHIPTWLHHLVLPRKRWYDLGEEPFATEAQQSAKDLQAAR